MSAQEFDVIVYGATGFTGRLVAEHLLQKYGVGGEVRWAMAGRDLQKLTQVAIEIGAPMDLPLLDAKTSDGGALDALAHRTRVSSPRSAPISAMASRCWRHASARGQTMSTFAASRTGWRR
jgi:short subunit dehydrogenase-like uncharacterized protein